MKITGVDIAIIIMVVFAISFIDFDKEAVKAFFTGGVIAWLLSRKGLLN